MGVMDSVKAVFISVSVTLILLVLLEVGVFVLSEGYYATTQYKDRSYDQNDTYLNYVSEVRAGIHTQYCSYLGHCPAPFDGDGYTVDADGRRGTVNPCGGEHATLIYTFGGSTTFCAETLDAHTWPSLFSAELCDRGYNVEVVNFGVTGYVSTQELVSFMLELRENPPDVAVFFDGSNEFFSAFQSGYAGEGQNLFNRQLAFSLFTDRNLLNPFYVTSTARAMRFLAGGQPLLYEASEAARIGDETRGTYAANIDLISVLAKEHDVETVFLWQPTVFTKEPLSEYEQAQFDGAPHKQFLLDASYQDVALMEENVDFYDVSDIFDGHEETLFIDHVHVGPQGNAIIASTAADIVERDVLS